MNQLEPSNEQTSTRFNEKNESESNTNIEKTIEEEDEEFDAIRSIN